MPIPLTLRKTGRATTRLTTRTLMAGSGNASTRWTRFCYPLQLAYLLWKETGETSQFDEDFVAATKEILHLWTVEQDHKNSPYRFVPRYRPKEDTLVNDGFGPDFAVTGMTWSAFRPVMTAVSIAALIPSNMFAVVVLGYVQEIFAELDLADSQNIVADPKRLQAGIRRYRKLLLHHQ